MTEYKRQSPKAMRDKIVRQQPEPPLSPARDMKHDDRGVANNRQTEDEDVGDPVERDGWNSNT